MRRKVPLSSLGVGRCFTLPVEAGGASDERPEGTRRSDPILAPDAAWRITGEGEAGVEAESAAGAARSFPPETEVVEIPRQGWDRLRSR